MSETLRERVARAMYAAAYADYLDDANAAFGREVSMPLTGPGFRQHWERKADVAIALCRAEHMEEAAKGLEADAAALRAKDAALTGEREYEPTLKALLIFGAETLEAEAYALRSLKGEG